MARIDRFIEALHRRGAERIRLVSGEKAQLVAGARALTVTATALDAKVLRAMLAEAAPADIREELLQPGEHSFVYSSPLGRLLIRAECGADSVSIEASPAAGEATSGGEVRAPETAAEVKAATPARPVPSATAHAEVECDGSPQDSVRSGPETAAMDALFREMVEQGCSDLHLSSASPPLFRKDGGMVALSSSESLSPSRTRELLYSITPGRHRAVFEQRHDADFSYEIPDLGRFRCNLFMDRKGMGGVFRVIPQEILTAEDLGLSEHILKLCHLSKGLVVVTGPTGSGKSTTLAAMIDYINRNRSAHIITIEDPIEFVHPNKQCLINQREIGNHTEGFKAALRAALREDPDIVLVGEMRDLETVEIAIETAETGHLVFGTLHTNTAASTVDRVIDQFPSDRQGQVRAMLASSLKGVIAQTLCKRPGSGRVAALEVLIVNAAISNLIREGKTFQIGSVMQTGKKLGMMTLNDALAELVVNELTQAEEAYTKAADRAEFARLLASRGVQLDLPGDE